MSLGALELRSEGGATRLRATFPYGVETELAPGRREIVAPRAFADRIERGEDVLFLSGHDMNKPLASRAAGSLTIRDTDAAVEMEAEIDAGTSWARDFVAAHAAGLIRGLSPGFRILPGGERIERHGNGIMRTITAAEVFEFSAVTKPAYPEAQITARSWSPGADAPDAGLIRVLHRWRA
jgi:HK97 family phage prohead protease